MNKNKIFTTLILLICITPLFSQNVLGLWKTIDDETGKEKSIFELYKTENGTYEGKVIELLDPDGIKVCDKCSGDKKGKSIKGMVLLSNLKQKGESFEGGTIVDPSNGKEYSCYIELEKPNKLKVRGYIGFALIGRTQYWYRAE